MYLFHAIVDKFKFENEKVKAGDSEEFDHGAMIVGNIDNSSPPVTKICIGCFLCF